jgi:hypothetical protein
MVGAWIPRRALGSESKGKETYGITQKKMVQTYWKTAKEKAELARIGDERLWRERRCCKLFIPQSV